MEKKKLTKELLDKVRHIEGFPKGKDEDIIELSNPPYFTACPNPFIQEFIDAHGTPYDEETDDYHREPFASDVSEGKNDPIYNAHSYHTKIPYKAIMRYILHYTDPGDIVFDGFSGTGMTGVAAQICENPDPEFKMKIEEEMGKVEWGARRAVLGDLSPIAAFISYNFNNPINVKNLSKEAECILKEIEKKCDWMYETQHIQNGEIQKDISGEPILGRINYTIWSDIFVCPQCSVELVYWDVAVEEKSGDVRKDFQCVSCGVVIKKKELERSWEKKFDKNIKKIVRQAKQLPVRINYSVGKKRFEKKPDEYDFNLLKKIDNIDTSYWVPYNEMPEGFNTGQPKISHGATHVHHFFSKRNLFSLGLFFDLIKKNSDKMLLLWFTSSLTRLHKMNRFMPNHKRHVGPLSGTLYISDFQAEISPLYFIKEKYKVIKKAKEGNFNLGGPQTIVQTQSTTDLRNIKTNSIDYIFTDPPFGGNLMYSELNFIWESWLKVFTNNKPEAIVNSSQKKGLFEYQLLMERCFLEKYRVLKPGRWLTMVFHNSRNAVWNGIQEALLVAGFIIADVRILDKKKGTTKQLSFSRILKKDLVVSAYKPKEKFLKHFFQRAGSEEGVWAFISQHLENLPVLVEKDELLDIVAERQNHLLYDRMVSIHIQNGYSVPMGVAEFYEGLKKKFFERDGMYFLPNQVAEYDKKRLQVKGVGQLSLFILDEKSAIQWLRSKLEQKPLTYQEIQPDFMREANFYRHEKGLELQEILEQNFLQDEEGRWYVPDPNKQADLEKLRERALLKEFDEYKESKGKLKKFRSEAIRAGFKHFWSKGDYKTIIEIAKRIPDSVLQEDSSILMYYNNALTREGQK